MRLRAGRVLALAATAVTAIPLAAAAAGHAPRPLGTVVISHQTLHFAVTVGPNNDVPCDVVADLYTPPGVSPRHPAPAILATNGFGGSKDDQAGLAQQFGREGYVFLSYSGLGFGGSSCKITLDDRDYDGKAGSQLISFLGGRSGNAFADAAHTTPVPAPQFVIRDDLAGRPGSDGRIHANDPRVGMIGGSYGGQIQFAVAGVDPRLDTIIPQITWNDLAYSLAPNNDANQVGVSYQAPNPGMEKLDWVSLFFGLGIADGVQGSQTDPKRNTGCPNFDNRACTGKAEMDAFGYPLADTIATERHASVAGYLDDIRIPTLLSQGQADTLFNLQEAAATFRGLQARHVPVKMIWQEWGHSGNAAAGEYSSAADANPRAFYDNARYLNWFDHYLKGSRVGTGPTFAWFRDDVPAGRTGLADPRYSSAASYPAGADQQLFLSAPALTNGTPAAPCSAGALVAGQGAVNPGLVTLGAPPGAPSSYTETSAVDQAQPVTDLACTSAVFTGAPLSHDATIVGVPRLTFRLDAATYGSTQTAAPAGQLVLFAKLYDVGPEGTLVLPHRLIAPLRVADVSKPVTMELPGVVHEVKAGHHLQLVISAGDAAYRGNARPGLVSVVLDPGSPAVLTLPLTR
ncbi:MAG: ABC transporter ATP-binding protein [Actinomycetota bacterium]|nr:ABC transporter ATP-binding protein [Actinomycetota bacterium]